MVSRDMGVLVGSNEMEGGRREMVPRWCVSDSHRWIFDVEEEDGGRGGDVVPRDSQKCVISMMALRRSGPAMLCRMVLAEEGSGEWVDPRMMREKVRWASRIASMARMGGINLVGLFVRFGVRPKVESEALRMAE